MPSTQYKSIIEMFAGCPFDNTYAHTLEAMDFQTKLTWLENNCSYKSEDDRFEPLMKIKMDSATNTCTVKIECKHSKAYYYNYAYLNNISGPHWFCFVTGCRYINDASQSQSYDDTGIYEFDLEIDLMMSNLLSPSQLKPCMIARQHSETDEIGENIVYEPVGEYDESEYNISQIYDTNDFYIAVCIATSDWKKLGISSSYLYVTGEYGSNTSGVPQMFPILLFDNDASGALLMLKYFDVNNREDKSSTEEIRNMNNVVACYLLPKWGVSSNASITWSDSDSVSHTTPVLTNFTAPSKNGSLNNLIGVDVPRNKYANTFEPKNKKMFTGQFYKLRVDLCGGEVKDYILENFSQGTVSGDNIKVNFAYILGVNYPVTLTLIPYFYQRDGLAQEYMMTTKNMPQIPTASDQYALWSNSGGQAQLSEKSLAQGVIGAVTALAGTALVASGVGAGIGAGLIAGGLGTMATTAVSTITTQENKKSDSNVATAGAVNNASALIMADSYLIEFKTVFPKLSIAENIDNFLTRFGYAQNRLMTPNTSARPYYTYLKISDDSYVPGVASGSANGIVNARQVSQINSILKAGITFWSRSITKDNIFKYDELDNSPS